MTEFEKKVLLTEKAYRVLLAWVGASAKTIVQKNYYFDTEDRGFYKRGITCRVREKNAKYVATIKQHLGEEKSEEYSKEVTSAFDVSLFADMGVSFQGSLITTRTFLCYGSGVHAVIDKNEYLGIIDYELEIEYIDGSQEQAETMMTVLLHIMLKHDVKIEEIEMNPMNKSERFFIRKYLIND